MTAFFPLPDRTNAAVPARTSHVDPRHVTGPLMPMPGTTSIRVAWPMASPRLLASATMPRAR